MCAQWRRSVLRLRCPPRVALFFSTRLVYESTGGDIRYRKGFHKPDFWNFEALNESVYEPHADHRGNPFNRRKFFAGYDDPPSFLGVSWRARDSNGER